MTALIDFEEMHYEKILNVKTFREKDIKVADKSHYFYYLSLIHI